MCWEGRRGGAAPDVITVPWLKGVTQNYILRHRQRVARWREREGRRIEAARESWTEEAMPTLESKELLNRVSAILPKRERALLALIRHGYSLPEASRMLGIPDGSRHYCQGRIVAGARRLLRRRMPGAVPGRTISLDDRDRRSPFP